MIGALRQAYVPQAALRAGESNLSTAAMDWELKLGSR